MPAAYPEEFRFRAVDLVQSDESLSAVARRLGISSSGLRRWVAQAEIDQGCAPGLSTEERKELTKLRRETVCCGWSVICSLERLPSSPRRTYSRNDL